ncbi:MAG: hypothetical protein GX879_03950 [Bacteroidales bacterium]|nr:hypothetical protein [Bacteroidales bacterium]
MFLKLTKTISGCVAVSILVFLVFFTNLTHAQGELVEKFEVKMISDSAAHNAFTDLIRYKKHFYCAFRVACDHAPNDSCSNGAIKIIRSKRGKKWETVALLSSERYDFRDPKLSIMPDGKLMILMGGSEYRRSALLSRLSHYSFSKDGVRFSEPKPVVIQSSIKSPYDWVWSITWHDTTGYAALYQINKPNYKWDVVLLKTYDGIHYDSIIQWDLGPRPNEARIRFAPDGRMLILVRRESGGNGILGISDPPYTDWHWHNLSMKLGGPNFIVLDNEKILIGSRIFTDEKLLPILKNKKEKDKTGIFLASINGEIRKVVELPSGGDTSYPGMLIHKKYLYITYYSSHDGKSKIYFAKAKLIDIENEF